MVYLNKIYTKTGDGGETSLGNGERVPKTDLRIAAYGAVDELNSLLGICATCELSETFQTRITVIQNDLFDLGADLCVPESKSPSDPDAPPPLRVTASQVSRLELWIDESNEQLKPLTSFILPGGSNTAAQLHLARAVCRRSELEVYHLMDRDPINPQVAIYLNRLSDLLFVMARVANANGKNDVLWVPGENRDSDVGTE
ncbi:MAG: cob(I)yrinic acid a,c-diamide adenosyltransferase [Planctomycetaceae bacterium]|nr:cob(I)yrinic acid a,c-diamide adenosyltransferase [Planctomycetaceae bacterium]